MLGRTDGDRAPRPPNAIGARVSPRVGADGTTLECDVRASAALEWFFTAEPFRTDYDVPIEAVPEGVRAIPVLARVCPVAWTSGADVSVDELDPPLSHRLLRAGARGCTAGVYNAVYSARTTANRACVRGR